MGLDNAWHNNKYSINTCYYYHHHLILLFLLTVLLWPVSSLLFGSAKRSWTKQLIQDFVDMVKIRF